MELIIKREVSFFKGVTFHFYDSTTVKAKYNMNGGLWLRKITVTLSENVIYVMKQREPIKKLFSLPFLFLLSPAFPEFHLFQNNKQIGKSYYRFSSSPKKIHINEDIYETYLHSKNYMSIFRNGIQIALIQRGDTIIKGSVDYNVICDEHFNKELLLLFTAFLDIVYWRSTWKFATVQKRVSFVLKEKFPEMIMWRPEE